MEVRVYHENNTPIHYDIVNAKGQPLLKEDWIGHNIYDYTAVTINTVEESTLLNILEGYETNKDIVCAVLITVGRSDVLYLFC